VSLELIRALGRSPWLETHLARAGQGRLLLRRLLEVSPALIEQAQATLPRAADLSHPALAPLVHHRAAGRTIEVAHLDVGTTSLGRLAGEGVLHLEALVLVVREAAGALAQALESTGLSHGALRPTKLRILDSGEVTVTGFGIDGLIDTHLLAQGSLPVAWGRFRRTPARIERTTEADALALVRVIEVLVSGAEGSAAQKTRVLNAIEGFEASPPPSTRELSDRLGELLRALRGPSNKAVAFDASLFDPSAEPGPARLRRRTAVFESGGEPTRSAAAWSETTAETVGRESTSTDVDQTRLLVDGGSALPPEIRVSPRSEPSYRTAATDRGGAEENAMLGQVLHGFRLVEVLSSGTYGHVFRGVHALLGHERAIKVVRAKFTGNEWVRRRVIREAERLLHLRHENLVEVHDLGLTTDQRPFIVMELLRGQNLAELVRALGPRPPGEAMVLVREIAKGLHVLHGQGIVHRDLKPANVMLVEGQGRLLVKVLDLGVARAAGETEATQLTRPSELVGTPAYMAPEQIEQPSEAGPAADQYALGLVWYALLAGAPPFTGDPYAVIERQRTEAPAPLDTPEWPLIARLLEKDPARRYPGVAELIQEIDARLGTGTQAARPEVGGLQRALLIFFGAVIVAALGAVGWVLGRLPLAETGTLPTSAGAASASPAASASASLAASASASPVASALPVPTVSPLEVVPEVEAEVDEVAPAPRRTPGPRTAPSSPSPTALRGRAAVLAWLRAHHFRAEDVPLLAPGAGGLDEPGLEERLTKAEISPALLKARLDRVLAKLKRASAALPLDDIAPIEQRYLALRNRSKAPADPGALNREIEVLEAELDRSAP